MKWLTPLDKPLSLLGLHAFAEEKGYIRLPLEVAEDTSQGVAQLAPHTAGDRIRFRTDSERIAVKVYTSTNEIMPHITAIGQCGPDVYTLTDRTCSYHCSVFPSFKKEDNGLSATRE